MHDILKLLGLVNRAKKVISGEDFCLEAIRKNEVKYLFLADNLIVKGDNLSVGCFANKACNFSVL